MGDAKKVWHALDVVADQSVSDAVEWALNELEAIGIEINYLSRKNGDDFTVTGYFTGRPGDNLVYDELRWALQDYGYPDDSIKHYSWRVIEDQDWLTEWKKHWRPTEVGIFIVAPPWVVDVKQPTKIVIRIEPNMAFGTGTHETTQLCLRAIDDNYRPGQTFLDVGCGTGILVIAAAKLAAENTEKDEKTDFLAFDIDPDSIKIAKENAAANGVGEKIEFVCGPIGGETRVFDFVCANLTIGVIVPLLPLLLSKTRKTLVLSGILVEQKNIIAAELEKFEIANFKFEIAGEWIAVIISME